MKFATLRFEPGAGPRGTQVWSYATIELEEALPDRSGPSIHVDIPHVMSAEGSAEEWPEIFRMRAAEALRAAAAALEVHT